MAEIECACMKYASPYIEKPVEDWMSNASQIYARQIIGAVPHKYYNWVWYNIERESWVAGLTSYPSKEEAMEALDKKLFSEGYELLDEERWSKLCLLM